MQTDVLMDSHAAQKAIPDLGYYWPDAKLKALGQAVQSVYPELSGWPPYLAAEAHLLYSSRNPSDPGAPPNARDVEFLVFLRAAVAGHVDRSESAALHG